MTSEERLKKYAIVMEWMRYSLSLAAMIYIQEVIEEIDLEAVLICHQLARYENQADPVILKKNVKHALKIRIARATWKAEELAARRAKRRACVVRVMESELAIAD